MSKLAPLLIAVAACLLSGLFGAWTMYGLLIVMAATALVLVFRRRALWLHDDLTTRLFALAFAAFALSFAASAQSIEDLIFVFNYAALLLYAPLAAALASTAHEKNALQFARVALVGAFGLAVWAAIQRFGLGVARPEGIEVDTIAYAHTAIVVGFIAGAGLLVSSGRWKWLFLFGPVFGTFTALLTNSRGPLLAVPFLALVLLIAYTRRPIVSLVVAASLALAGLGAVSMLSPSTFARISSITDNVVQLVTTGDVTESSAGQRIEMYRGAVLAFLDAPVFGHGWEQKFEAIAPYLSEDSRLLRRGHHHLHSDYFDVAVSNGILGLIGHVLMLVGPLVGALFSARDGQYRIRLTLAAMIGGAYAIFGLTYLLFGYEYHTTLYVVLAALILGYCRDTPPLRELPKPA